MLTTVTLPKSVQQPVLREAHLDVWSLFDFCCIATDLVQLVQVIHRRGHENLVQLELSSAKQLRVAMQLELSSAKEYRVEGTELIAKATRAESRKVPTFGKGRLVNWKRRALSAYTWMRTGRGPQKEWLYRIRAAADQSCPCGGHSQSGEHVVWHCRLHDEERRRNRIHQTRAGEWGDLDDPIWVPNDDVEGREESDQEQVDGVERFFEYLSFQF